MDEEKKAAVKPVKEKKAREKQPKARRSPRSRAAASACWTRRRPLCPSARTSA